MDEEVQSATAITTAEYNKLKEKAEKWDQYAIYDNEKEEEILVKDLITAYEKLGVVKAWAEEELSENSRIADAKYEEVMEGDAHEAPELNYYTGRRDLAKELLKILEREAEDSRAREKEESK